MPRIKYSAMTGEWSAAAYDFETRSNTDVEVETPFKVLLDFGSIQTGVVHFPPSGAPDIRVVPEGEDLPDYPMDEDEKGNLLFKPCIVLRMFSPALGAREAMLTSAAARTGVEDLYTTFTAAPEAQAGKVPVVLVRDAVATTFGKPGRKTTLYRPVFEIAAWAERVPEFGARTVRPPQPSLPLSGAAMGVTRPAAPSWSAASLEDEIPF